MSERTLDRELDRLMQVDEAVRSYLSHLWAYEQGSTEDGYLVEHWRDQLSMLTED